MNSLLGLLFLMSTVTAVLSLVNIPPGYKPEDLPKNIKIASKTPRAVRSVGYEVEEGGVGELSLDQFQVREKRSPAQGQPRLIQPTYRPDQGRPKIIHPTYRVPPQKPKSYRF